MHVYAALVLIIGLEWLDFSSHVTTVNTIFMTCLLEVTEDRYYTLLYYTLYYTLYMSNNLNQL